jgi:hypothetical protein
MKIPWKFSVTKLQLFECNEFWNFRKISTKFLALAIASSETARRGFYTETSALPSASLVLVRFLPRQKMNEWLLISMMSPEFFKSFFFGIVVLSQFKGQNVLLLRFSVDSRTKCPAIQITNPCNQ